MRKITLLAAILMVSSVAFAATGWFNDFLTIKVDGVETSNNYYIGVDPATGATALQGKAFGTVASLEITGCDMKYWADGGDNRTGGAFYYKVTNAANTVDIVAATEVIWDHAAIGGNDYQGTKATTINLLAGLPYGSYQLHVWAKSWGTVGDDNWLSNGSANYVATFTKAAPAVALAGTYKVGTVLNADFDLLSTAVTAINANGISGDVVLEIASDITETVNIGLVSNSNNTITIRPDADVNRTITFNKATDNAGPSGAFCLGIGMGLAWADLSPTKNVVIDGFAVGGTTRRLKIATAVTHQGGNGPILLMDDCSNIQIKNCIIHHLGASTGSSNYGIYLRVNSAYGTKKMPTNVLIENNHITATQNTASQAIGIYANAAPTSLATGIIIKKNTIIARTRGIFLYYTDNLNILENEFRIAQTAGGVLSSAIMGNAGQTGDVNILGNKFLELKTANTSAGAFGIRAIIASGGGTWNIYNNFFTGFDKTTATAGETMLQGIRCGSNCNIMHNTFFLNALTNKPTYVETPGETTANYSAINIAAGTNSFKNNIFISNEDAVYNFAFRGTVASGTSDYNVFYPKAGSTKARVNSVYPLFQDYVASGVDAHSKMVDVEFANAAAGDLSIAGNSVQDANLKVPSLAAVTTDIFGTVRNTEFTYAGAHESTLPFIVTSVENPSEQVAKVMRTATGIQVELEGESTIELYTLNGVLIEKTRTNGTYTRDLNNGVYIIRINGKATKFVK